MNQKIIDHVESIYKKQANIMRLIGKLELHKDAEYIEALTIISEKNCKEVIEITKNCDHKFEDGSSAILPNAHYCAICLKNN